jgi:type I restriction enzyme S subunit
MSLPKYERYTSVELRGLKEKPEHWDASRLRFTVKLNPSKQELKDFEAEETASFLPMEAIGEGGSLRLEQEKEIGECLSGYTYFRDGDVCLAKITPCFENGKGAVLRGLKNGLGFGTTELIVARPLHGKVIAEFVDYLFRSQVFRDLGESEMYGAGGQKRVPDSFVRDFVALLPPIREQVLLANFLDRETAKIDALIAEQQRLIELLQEKRQAVISHAVTKGLNPNAAMKDSGVEWLGEVPEHWEMVRLKTTSSFTTSGPRGWSERISEDGALFVQSGDLTDSLEINFEGCKRVHVEADAEALRTRLALGDVVVCITGAKTGNVAVIESLAEDAYVNQHLCLIRPNNRVHPSFMGLLLKSGCGQTHFALAQYGLKQGLSLENVREAPVPCPPYEEQSQIVAYSSEMRSRFWALEAESRGLVEVLKERRSALISAAVTGQIDIRRLVPEAEEQ